MIKTKGKGESGPTCQSVGPTDAEAHSEEREGVNEVHTEVEDALEQHHHEPQLCDTGRHRETHKC